MDMHINHEDLLGVLENACGLEELALTELEVLEASDRDVHDCFGERRTDSSYFYVEAKAETDAYGEHHEVRATIIVETRKTFIDRSVVKDYTYS